MPTGTTGDIVVTPSSSNLGCGIAVFRALHIAAAVHDTDTDLDGSDPETNSIDIPANGILISALCGNGAGTRVTWTGVTESYDEAVDGGGNDFKHGGGSDAFSSSETGRSVTASVAGAQVTASISFGPG